jgi:cell division protein FtsB
MHLNYWLKKKELKENKEFYITRIADVKQQKENLFKDDFALEKYAREELLMSKEGEDIYLIQEPEADN